ncbi:hypothetical protein [Paraburkholderia caribensis]|jgi:hypothetical protein|uniref:hypothetical protein n=1 Tax=Paraburkholderia caribensis TaxID=75105 RepID=UPI00078B99ED|nr:hypothetical protein [Paraburkholderia caribensis]AMV44681.1 hypothetical protein ATN79_22325 [Paraburkholderia caribensis]MDR6383177.1 hypothetical protein [Paraburkholderia caribensis]
MARKPGLLVGAAVAASVFSIAAQAQHIRIESGTYGANCGAASGNATRDLAKHCNDRATCRYIVNARLDAKQRASCARDFTAAWSCDHREFHRAMLSAEAGNGSSLVLTCVPSTGAGK